MLVTIKKIHLLTLTSCIFICLNIAIVITSKLVIACTVFSRSGWSGAGNTIVCTTNYSYCYKADYGNQKKMFKPHSTKLKTLALTRIEPRKYQFVPYFLATAFA